MQNDLISRSALSAHFAAMQECANLRDHVYLMGVLSVIDNAPSADATFVVHACWATDEEDLYWGNALKRKHCSNCRKRAHFDKTKREFVLTAFCGHCGAKMDLNQKSNG